MSEPNDSIIGESTANNATPDENKVEVVDSLDESTDIASDETSTNDEVVEDAKDDKETPPNVDEISNQSEIGNSENIVEAGFAEAQIKDLEIVTVSQHPMDGEILLQANQNHKKEETAVPTKPLTNEEVTEHTASLWKYLPIPSDEPEAVPEYINSTIRFPGSKIIGARVRGKKHKHEGTNCDDWYEVANYEQITFVAVSDGAGSKKFSRIGARESCKAAVGYLVSSFEKLFADKPELKDDLSLPLSEPKCMEACGVLAGAVQQSVIKAHEAVEAAFYSRKTNPEYEKVLGRALQFKDLSGTLLITVIIPISESSKEKLVISCQIGDGMIAVLDSEGEFTKSMKLMGVPDSGDFSGETDFLTSSQMKNLETLQHRTKIARTSIDTVMVMSDGVADDYFPNETEMRRLYFDLIVNGVLDESNEMLSLSSLTQAQMKLFKRVPDPLVYPWVNDQSVKIPIQYTKRIEESLGMTLEDIWKDRTVLDLAKIELAEAIKGEDPSERLKVWLDNYVERGSFDDRTLVVVTM